MFLANAFRDGEFDDSGTEEKRSGSREFSAEALRPSGLSPCPGSPGGSEQPEVRIGASLFGPRFRDAASRKEPQNL